MKRRKPNFIWIKVTSSSLYAFDPERIDNRTPGEIIEEFFKNYPLDSYHTTRDAHRVGFSSKLISAEVLSEEEVSKCYGKESGKPFK